MAGSLNRRDIEMIFRAETDAAQRPVAELKNDIKGLRQGLSELIKETDKTERSMDKLASTERDLKKAQDELGTARSLLTNLNTQAGALDKLEDKLSKAEAKYAGLKAQMEGADQPSKRLQNSFEAAGRAVERTSNNLESARKDFGETKASIEAIIGPVENFKDSFRDIAVAQNDVRKGLAITTEAAAEFRREIAAAGNVDAFRDMAIRSPVSAETIEYISQFENRVELLKLEEAGLEAQRKGAAAAETARKQKQLSEIDQLLAGNRQLDAQFDDMIASSARLESVNAYQQIARDSIAASNSARQVAENMDKGAISGQRLADAILGIVNPAAAASVTLQGTLDKIDEVDARMRKGGLATREYGALANDLSEAQANMLRLASAIDQYTDQERKVRLVTAAFDDQERKVQELANKLAAFDGADAGIGDGLVRDLRAAERQLESLGTELTKETGKLTQFGQGLDRVGIDVRQLDGVLVKLQGGAQRAAGPLANLNNIMRPGGKGAFLGLDPLALQNLGYQVNDIFTSLASGANPLMVLAQQSGQIAQIPGIFAAIRMAALPLAAVLIPLGIAFAGLSEEAGRMARRKDAEATIAGLGEAAKVSVDEIMAAQKQLREWGATTEEAAAATKVFVREGLNPAMFDDFNVAVTNGAKLMGVDLADAAEKIGTTFSGTADDVIALDDQFHFLTDSQRDQLLASKDQKNETDEVRKAFEQFYKKAQDVANAQNGPWKQATSGFRVAWQAMLEGISDTGVIDWIMNKLTNAIIGVTGFINLLRRLGTVAQGASSFMDIGIRVAATGGWGNMWDQAKNDTIAQIKRSQVPLDRAQSAPGQRLGQGSRGDQRIKEDQDKRDRKQAEKDAKKRARDAEADAKRRKREAEQLAKQYANEQDQLTTALSRFTAQALKGKSGVLDAQLANARMAVDEQFKSLEDRLEEFGAKFGKDALINGISQTEYRARLDAQKAEIKNQKQLAVYEDEVNDLLKQRDDRLKTINEQQSSGLIDAATALDQAREVTSDINPKLVTAIALAKEFISSLAPSEDTRAMLAKFNKAMGQTGEGDQSTILRKEALQGANIEEQKLNTILEGRNALVAAQVALYDLGLQSEEEMQGKIEQAYATSKVAIDAQIDSMRNYLLANRAMLDPAVFETFMAQLQATSAQAQYVNQNLKNVQDAARGAIVDGITNMFNVFADGLAKIITGGGNVIDLLQNMGRAALGFAAQFLKAIADVLLQLMALRVAKALVGADAFSFIKFHGGGTVGDFSHGVQRSSARVSPAALAGIPRYHSGTPSVGLAHNERMAILETGERVTTEEQQEQEKRRLAAARKGGNGDLRQVLAFGDEEVAGALAGRAGERVILTQIKRNKTVLRQLLGVK